MSRVEVLFFGGCPNVDIALARARKAAEATGVADVRLVPVESEDDARRLGFLGSPTVRVDGLDVEVSARARTDFGLQCRVYSVGGRMAGVPPVEWVEAALQAAVRR